YHKQGQYPELVLLHSQTYLDGLKPESRIILGAIVLCYTRNNNTASITQCEAASLMEIWARFFNNLWPDLVSSGPDTRRSVMSPSVSGRSTPTSPVSPVSPSDTLYSFSAYVPSMMRQFPVTSFDNSASSLAAKSAEVDAKGTEGGHVDSTLTPARSSSSSSAGSLADKARLKGAQATVMEMKDTALLATDFKLCTPREVADKAFRHAKQDKDEAELKSSESRRHKITDEADAELGGGWV
ncbi:hypothetical protein BGZ65_004660, partial [Modicella reniformis]